MSQIQESSSTTIDSDTGCVRKCCRVTASCLQQTNMPLLLSLALITTAVVFTTSRYMFFDNLDRFPLWFPDAINIAMMSVATIAALVLLCKTGIAYFKKCYSSGISCNSRLTALEWCERVAAVVFLVGSMVFHSFRARGDLECWSEWQTCEDRNISWYQNLDTVHNFVQMIFILFVCLLCLFFEAGTGPVNVWVLLGLSFIQCANFAMWFDAVLEESEILPHSHNSTLELETCHVFFDVTTFNTSALVECFTESAPGYVLEAKATPYMFPFIIEFLLLAIKIVFDFLLGERHGGLDGSDDVMEVTAESGCTGRIGFSVLGHFVFCAAYFAFSVSINVAFFVLGILTFYTEDPGNIKRDAFAVFRLAYWIGLFLIALIGIILVAYAARRSRPTYSRLYDANSSEDPPTSVAGEEGTNLQHLVRFEYFVVLCSVGPLAHIFFTMIANLHTSHDVSPTHLFLAEEIFNIAQILTQTAFYIYAAKAESITERCENQRVKALIKAAIFVFFMSNLSLWAEDSFVEAHHKDKFFQNEYYQYWVVIYNVTNPVSLSYRMNSMFLFASLYFRLWASGRHRNITNDR